MTTPEDLPPTPEEPLVTFIPALGEVVVTAATGEVISEPASVEGGTGFAFDYLAGTFSQIYLQCGPGIHTIPDIAEQAGLSSGDVLSAVRRFDWLLPSDLVDTEGITQLLPSRPLFPTEFPRIGVEPIISIPALVLLGPMRLASRRPTVEELAVRNETKAARAAVKAAALEERRVETLAADLEKIDTTRRDHALVTLHGHHFHIPLESRQAIIAARTIEAVASLDPGQTGFTDKSLYATIWQLMSLAERRMFTDKDEVLYAHRSATINKEVDAVLNGLTGRMNITRRGRSASHYYMPVPPEDIAVSYHEEPIDAAELERVSTVLPPGIPRTRIETAQYGEATPENTAFAEEVVRLAASGENLSQTLSIEILDFIMGSAGKQALRVVLERQGRPKQFKAVLERVHLVLRGSLGGMSYWTASRARMIKGYGSHGSNAGVQQVSGGLPTTTKWYIGVMGDASAAARKRTEDS